MSPRTARIARGIVAVLGSALIVAVVVAPLVALARVGGGESFGRPSGGSSGGDGGGGDLLLILFQVLLDLCIHYPIVGVPLTLGTIVVVVGVFAVRLYAASGDTKRQVHRTRATPRRSGVPGLAALAARDPGFSAIVLADYLALLHRRAHEVVGRGDWAPLAPFVTDEARKQLVAAYAGVSGVSEVVVGGLGIKSVQSKGGFDELVAEFEVTQLETASAGGERRVDCRELWTLRRKAGATSLPPDRIEAMGCPSCGSPIEVTPMGACTSCGSPITRGELQWQAVAIRVVARTPASVPQVSRSAGGDEGSVRVPTVYAPDLSAGLRALKARHPEFSGTAFAHRVEHVYLHLQGAWSAGRWQDARPYVTDRMYQTNRFWVEKYTRNKLRNQLDAVEMGKLEIVKVDVDAWYEAITVRLWGSMVDTVVDADGKVVGGNPKVARRFSEYWTFLRAAGEATAPRGGADQCPSCGAPLDRVSQAGVCGYCDAKITSGRFDWVLARIDQPEAYGG